MSDRGMKKWNAYKSLPEHDPAVRTSINKLSKVEKPKISSEEAEAINEILVNYEGEEVEISYYRKGEIIKISTTIKKIDPYNRVLLLNNGDKIYLKELVGLKRV